MKKLVTLLILMVAVISTWAQVVEREEFRFDINHQMDHPNLQIPLSRDDSNPAGGFAQGRQTLDKIIRKAPKAQATAEDGGTHLGYATNDKLEYAIFQFNGSPSPVATLIGWADSYDYYPNIVVPDNVTFNGKTIPVTAINDYAFINGWGITGLTIGKNVAYIGIQAFAGCNISTLSIPVAVHQIGGFAFQSCPITTISFEDATSTDNPLIIGSDSFIYNKFCSIELPARLKVSDENSFRASFNNPFYGNVFLESITINSKFNSVNRDYTLEINQGALCQRYVKDDIEYLNVISYPTANTQNKVDLRAGYIDVFDYAFADCKLDNISLTSTSEPRDGKVNMTLGYSAFEYSNITSLEINAKGRISLRSGFSDGCRFLAKYDLSEDISNYKAFDGVIYAKKDGELYLDAYPCGRTDASFIIPSDVMHLAACSFNSNPYITEVTLPSELKTIGNKAFRNCVNLERLIFTGNNLASIGQNALDYTKVIALAPQGAVTIGNWLIGYKGDVPSNLVIPENVNNAASGIFKDKTEITSVTFPQNFESIPSEMFAYCYNLTSIQFSSNLKTIGSRAFYYAGINSTQPNSRSGELSTLTIPDGVSEIGIGAFANSRLADKLVLPSTLNILGDYSLGGEFSEVEIHRSTPPEIEDDVNRIFSQGTLDGTLIIPKDADPLSFTQNPYWNFSKVVNGDFASINNVEIEQGQINVSYGTIFSTDGKSFTLYATDGRFVGNGSSFSGLTPGIYIVRLGSVVQKYVVL